jgi:hypothetical protein
MEGRALRFRGQFGQGLYLQYQLRVCMPRPPPPPGQGEVSTGGVPAVPAEGVYAPPLHLLGLQAGQGEVTPSQQGVRLLAY